MCVVIPIQEKFTHEHQTNKGVIMKGKVISEKVYPVDELRMRTYIDFLKKDIASLKKTKIRCDEKITNIEIELKKNENMDLEDWLLEHPNPK